MNSIPISRIGLPLDVNAAVTATAAARQDAARAYRRLEVDTMVYFFLRK